ncbi:hypothetical protein HOLleu_19166 [Holothuria leucospilota]|uniref:Death domain-containing protein n=1 Tax=Holothuria leucospilota TaxID=206669 RepID=A0A9Q1C4Y0_HOLLE|nr:hypothetical protein HOLleu_19166 [Holothuria leucospilota]
MGYSANQAFKRLYEGKLIEISQDKKSAERWVEILELPQSDTNNVQHLRLDIYRVRFNVKAEKKADFPINNTAVLGIERGTVQTDQNDFKYQPILVLSTVVKTLALAGTEEKLAHAVGLEYQEITGATSTLVPVPSRTSQPTITDALQRSIQEAYRKLLTTAYYVALDGLPLSSFKTFVVVQKKNGVQLLNKTDSNDRAAEFVHELADAIRRKIAILLQSAVAFSVLSDGSQARKTGKEKELVMVRVIKAGQPVYFVAALEDIDEYGDANAENLHRSINNAFQNKLKIGMAQYTNALVSATADGASVNTGIYNGLLVRMRKAERPWLVMIHCVSHRLELAVKDTLMKEKTFEQVKDLMITIYYVMKNSGKFKRHFEETAHALGIQVYKFPKVHGTRFVAHQRNGVRILLHNWIILAHAIENSIANNKHSTLNAKLHGILKKLRSVHFLSATCLFFEILDVISALSLKFQKGELHAFEVMPAIEQTQLRVQELQGEESGFPVKKAGYTVNETQISCQLPKEGHMRRSVENQEFVMVTLDRMVHVAPHRGAGVAMMPGSDMLKQSALSALTKCLKDRFTSFNHDLYKHMHWINPANWRTDDVSSEMESLEAVGDYFSTTLLAAGYESTKIKREWSMLKVVQRNYYQGFQTSELWGQILQYRKNEFPNLCLLVEVVMAMGVSNATVESGFSVLSSMMSDRRISLKHARMEDLMLIKANDRIWLETEREAIIDDALDQFMQKKRRKQRLELPSPVEKRPRHDLNPDPKEHSSCSSSSSASREESEPELELSFSGLEESDVDEPEKRKRDDLKEDAEPAEDEKSVVSEEPDVLSEPDMLAVSSPTKTTSSSFRVYQNSPNVKQQDLVVHATSQYISTTKVTQLKVQEHWDLRNVCQVSHHDRCVGITIFGTDLAGSATGYKEFTLKNESFAAKFAAEIGERLSKVAEREVLTLKTKFAVSGSNEYTTGPTVRENFATSTPSTSPTLALAHPLQGSNLHISERVGLSQSKDNVVENVTYAWKLDSSDMAITHHPPAWKLDSSKMAVTHHPPPPLPKRKPQPEPRRKVEEASHPQPPQGATPLKKETHNGEPPRPSPRSPTYTRSNSEGCGIDSWRTFVSHLGVEEEEIASISVSKAMYPVRDRCRPEIKRSDRASIVPKRPKARSGDCIKPYGPGGATSQPKSNYSLYPFLFHVWNSEEIIADTLGMSLLTWQDFVVYFELSSSSFTTMNDWKGLAERIGMSPVDIQVIDNYSRRFNQCASAIVMLFWQHNAPHLNEEYTRPVLLKILSDLEREDLIDVILKGKG